MKPRIKRLLLALIGFVLFVIVDTTLPFWEMVVVGLSCIVLAMAYWLQKKKKQGRVKFRLTIYRMVKGVGYLLFMGLVFVIIRLTVSHSFDAYSILVIVGVVGTLCLTLYLKNRWGIVNLNEIGKQQEYHTERVMQNRHAFPLYAMFTDWMLRKHPDYTRIQNRISLEEVKTNYDRKNRVFMAIFPLSMLIVIILFATGLLK